MSTTILFNIFNFPAFFYLPMIRCDFSVTGQLAVEAGLQIKNKYETTAFKR